MATVQLVSGAGTTKYPEKFKLVNYPWVYLGGEIDTLTSGAGTGAVTYYGLDNTNIDVLRLGCYRDVSVEPVVEETEDWCDGKRITDKRLTGWTITLTVTQDLIDLNYLRWFLRQHSQQFGEDTDGNIQALKVDDLRHEFVIPLLIEHHYKQDGTADDQYEAYLFFEAEILLGAIEIDPNEGYSAELTIDVRRSETYEGYFCVMRHDTVEIV